jgi:phage-related protein
VARGVTIDLIVDPKGAIKGINQVEDAAGGLSNGLATVGTGIAAGVAALGLAAVGAVAGLASATKGAAAYAEEVSLAASKTHLSTDAVQELQYASKITGVEFETISGSLTKLTKSLGTAASGNGASAEAFAKLGVATTDANGNLRESTAVYSDVLTALGGVTNETERDVLAMQLLGKSATELNPLIDGSAGSLTELAAQARDAGAVLSGEMLEKLGSVDDALDGLSAGADAAKNALGLTLMPVLQELGTQGTGLLGEFTNAVLAADGDLSKAAPAIGAVFGSAVEFILGILPQFLEVGTSMVSSIITGIAAQAPSLITAAVPVLTAFVVTLLGQLPMLLDAGAKVLIALVEGVAKALPTLIPAAVAAIVGLVGALIKNLPLILNAGLQLIKGLVTGIISALPTLIAALPQIILGLVNFLVSAIPQIIDTGIELLLSLVTALPEIITGIVDALPLIITGIINGVLGAIPKLIDAGLKLFLGLIGALPQIISALVKSIPEIITGIVGAFTNPATLTQLGNAGIQLINGLWTGIKGTASWLWTQLQSFFGDIIKNIKKLLGIKSPSTVFASMGDFLIQGLEKGLTAPNNINGIMSDISGQVTDGFQGSLATTARATVTTAVTGASAPSGAAGGAAATNGAGGNTFVFPNFLGTDKAAVARMFDDIMATGRRNGDVSANWATSG